MKTIAQVDRCVRLVSHVKSKINRYIYLVDLVSVHAGEPVSNIKMKIKATSAPCLLITGR